MSFIKRSRFNSSRSPFPGLALADPLLMRLSPRRSRSGPAVIMGVAGLVGLAIALAWVWSKYWRSTAEKVMLVESESRPD